MVYLINARMPGDFSHAARQCTRYQVPLVSINDPNLVIWKLVTPCEDPVADGYAAIQLQPTVYPDINLNVYQDDTLVYARVLGIGRVVRPMRLGLQQRRRYKITPSVLAKGLTKVCPRTSVVVNRLSRPGEGESQ
jgi:hypothetical protein